MTTPNEPPELGPETISDEERRMGGLWLIGLVALLIFGVIQFDIIPSPGTPDEAAGAPPAAAPLPLPAPQNAGCPIKAPAAPIIWSYLISKGLSPPQVAGVMGNMQAEAGFVPTRHQSSSGDVWDSGRQKGWGLVQWDSGRRYQAPDRGVLGRLRAEKPHLAKYIDISYDTVRNPHAQIPPHDFNELVQFELDYMIGELQVRPAKGFGNEWVMLASMGTIEDALVAFHHEFEISHLMNKPNPRQAVLNARLDFAKAALRCFS